MKKLKKDILGMVGVGVLSGVGATAVDKAGGDSTPIKTAASFMPVMGTLVSAGAMMRQVDNLNPKHRKRKRRR